MTLTLPNFFTLAGMGLERRNLNQMKTGLFQAEEQGPDRLKRSEEARIPKGAPGGESVLGNEAGWVSWVQTMNSFN